MVCGARLKSRPSHTGFGTTLPGSVTCGTWARGRPLFRPESWDVLGGISFIFQVYLDIDDCILFILTFKLVAIPND